MDTEILKDIYQNKQFDIENIESKITLGKISERDKFKAAKQILFGISILYMFTILAYMFDPIERNVKLIDICMTVFPSLATLIIAFYFKEKDSY